MEVPSQLPRSRTVSSLKTSTSVAGGKLVVPAATPNSAKAFTGKAITETLRPPEAPNHDSPRNASNNPSIATADSDHSDSDSQAGGRQHTRTRSFGSDLRAIYKGTSPKKVAALFPEIDSVENPITVIDVYSCALEKDILWQGRLYLTSTHIGFHGVIFGKTERLVVNLRDVISIEKKLIAGMFPNAIKLTLLERSVRSFYHSLVDADHAQYTFGSFLKRDSAYFDISTQWKLVRVRLQPFKQSALPGRSNASEDEQADTSRSNITQDFEKGWDFAPRIRATTEVAVSTPTVALLERIPSAGNVQKRVFSFPSSSLDPLGVLAPPGMDLYEACLSVKEEMIHRRAVDHVSSEGGNSSGKFTVSNERGKRKPADNQPAKDSNDPPNQSNGNPEDNDNLSKDVLNSVVKGPVRCPCERHDGVLLVNETFDFNFKGFLHTALKEGHGSKTMHDTYTSCGTDGIIFWDWETGDDGSKSRKIEYTARFGGVLDGQDIFCKDRQQILHLTDDVCVCESKVVATHPVMVENVEVTIAFTLRFCLSYETKNSFRMRAHCCVSDMNNKEVEKAIMVRNHNFCNSLIRAHKHPPSKATAPISSADVSEVPNKRTSSLPTTPNPPEVQNSPSSSFSWNFLMSLLESVVVTPVAEAGVALGILVPLPPNESGSQGNASQFLAEGSKGRKKKQSNSKDSVAMKTDATPLTAINSFNEAVSFLRSSAANVRIIGIAVMAIVLGLGLTVLNIVWMAELSDRLEHALEVVRSTRERGISEGGPGLYPPIRSMSDVRSNLVQRSQSYVSAFPDEIAGVLSRIETSRSKLEHIQSTVIESI